LRRFYSSAATGTVAKPDWRGDITALYCENPRNRHPDAGGSDTLMAELNVAYSEARRELGL